MRKKKLAAKIDSLQKKGQRRAYVKGPLRNSKKEAHADLSKAQKGATDSTGVVRGLAAARRLDPRSKTDTKILDRLKTLAKPNDDAVLHSSDATDATTTHAFACAVPPTSDGEWVEPSTKRACSTSSTSTQLLLFDM